MFWRDPAAQVLEPATMKRDVCYWMNEEAARTKRSVGCLNTAVEATSLNDRAFNHLLPQAKPLAPFHFLGSTYAPLCTRNLSQVIHLLVIIHSKVRAS